LPLNFKDDRLFFVLRTHHRRDAYAPVGLT
jgi:hypothetical protein